MADYRKGITIEFNGETTKLDRALGNIKRNTRSLDTELKGINSALKFNPTSVDLWKQKQTVLTEKISETGKRLDVLKQAQADMDARNVDKNSAEYRDLQREIITTESQLKHFKGQLQQIGNVKLKALSEQFKQIGTKMTDTGKKLTTGLTVPIAGVGAASIKAFTEVKDGLNIVAQKTGATGEELKGMQDITRDLAKTIPTDFQSAGTAVGELNTRFGLTGQALEDLSGQYIKFAKVNDVDLNSSIDETQKALAAFGKSAEDAPALLDTLTRAGQLTGASVDDLTSGLIQNATAFQELGLSMDQSVMLMAQMEKSGANSETVMQGLRKALKNAAADGVPLDQALTDLQNTIVNGKDGMDGLTAAYDLFGKSGDQIYGAVKNGTIDFSALGAAIEDTGGTLDSVFEETLTPAEKFQTTMNSVKDAGYELGNTIMTMLAPYMDKLAQTAQKLSTWWAGLDDNTKKLITTIAMIVAVVGPALVIIGKLATGISAIINVVNLASGAIGALGASTLLPIIAIIAAVVAIGIVLYKNWDTIKAKAQELWAKIKDVFSAIGDFFQTIFNFYKTLFQAVWGAIFGYVKWYVNLIKTIITTVFNAVKTVITTIWNVIKKVITTAWTAIVTAIKTRVNLIKTVITTVFNSIKGTVSRVWNGIKQAIVGPIEKAVSAVKAAINKIKNIVNGAHLKLPHFKLPHFKISGGKLPWGIGGKGVAPKIDVDWYAKGGIFNSPTVAGIGEAGPEAVVPLDTLWDKLDAIAQASQGAGVVININGYNKDARVLAAEIEQIIIQKQKQRRFANGTAI